MLIKGTKSRVKNCFGSTANNFFEPIVVCNNENNENFLIMKISPLTLQVFLDMKNGRRPSSFNIGPSPIFPKHLFKGASPVVNSLLFKAEQTYFPT